MSKYMNREHLSWVIICMLEESKRMKSKRSISDFYYNGANEYWKRTIDKVTRSIEHYCDTAGIYVDVNPLDMKYTIGQLEVIKFILDRRRNCGNKVF